jgi:predicted nucleic acid-binding protein
LIVAIDSTVLLHLIGPDLAVSVGQNGERVEQCYERLQHAIDTMSKNNDTIVVPTPVLAEILTKAGPVGNDWLSTLHGKRAIRIAPFDEMAAIECAALARTRKARSPASTRNKAKFDEQIVAIAVANRAEKILSDDADIRKLAPASMHVQGIDDLDLPPAAAQGDMFAQPDSA